MAVLKPGDKAGIIVQQNLMFVLCAVLVFDCLLGPGGSRMLVKTFRERLPSSCCPTNKVGSKHRRDKICSVHCQISQNFIFV